MAEIIRMPGGTHDQTERLLPWYVSGTLSAEETTVVEQHLGDCEACRTALAAERSLAAGVARMPLDVELGWAAMQAKLSGRGESQRLLSRRISILWAAAGPLAAAAALTVVIALPHPSPSKTYVALGSNTAARAGNVLVMFRPEVSERVIAATLTAAAARIVDGPTVSGGYVIAVEPSTRDRKVAALREAPAITLAEAIDTGPAR